MTGAHGFAEIPCSWVNGMLLEAHQPTPSSPGIAHDLGIVALRRKDLESAGSWFQKAAEEAPCNAAFLGDLGPVRWMQHRWQESCQIGAKAFSEGYEPGLGHYLLGTVGLGKAESQEAVKHLGKIPADRFAYRDLCLSIAIRNCGKNKAADESFRNFVRRNPAPCGVSLLSE
jgi:tetratricopeptide (TPR) repeat protein